MRLKDRRDKDGRRRPFSRTLYVHLRHVDAQGEEMVERAESETDRTIRGDDDLSGAGHDNRRLKFRGERECHDLTVVSSIVTTRLVGPTRVVKEFTTETKN